MLSVNVLSLTVATATLSVNMLTLTVATAMLSVNMLTLNGCNVLTCEINVSKCYTYCYVDTNGCNCNA